MKPSVGRWVHYNQLADNKVVVWPALIVRCTLRQGVGIGEEDYDVTLEVHAVTSGPGPGGPRPLPDIRLMEKVPYSPARSGHDSAWGRWTWPPRES